MKEIKIDIRKKDDGQLSASLDINGLFIIEAPDFESLENEIKSELKISANINPDEVVFDYNPL